MSVRLLACALLSLASAAFADQKINVARPRLQPMTGSAANTRAGSIINTAATPVCFDSNGPVTCDPNTMLQLDYFGGHVIANAKVYVVFWTSTVASATKSGIAGFYQALTNSTWMDWLNEYNTNVTPQGGGSGTNQFIGRGTYAGTYTLPSLTQPSHTCVPSSNGVTPTGVTCIWDTDVPAEINAQINAGHLPPPDANTIYMSYFPSTYFIQSKARDSLNISDSCVEYCAYHSTYTRNSASVYFAVMPDLSANGCQSGCGGHTVFQNLCSASSHELGEAITDAEVGLATTNGPPLAWYDNGSSGQGEVGDMCNQLTATITSIVNGTSYTVQQLFSHSIWDATPNASTQACVASRLASSDFDVFINPNTASVAAGASVSIPVHVEKTNGSSLTTALAFPSSLSLPTGVTAHFDKTSVDSVTPGGAAVANLIVQASASAAVAKDLVIYFTGTSGSLVHSASLLVQVDGAPTGAFTAPANNATVSGTQTPVTVTATAGSGTTISTVQVTLDSSSTPLHSSTSGFTFNWDTTTVSDGAHTLHLTVTDADGGTFTVARSVTVSNGNANDFSVSINSGDPASLHQGGQATVDVGVAWVAGTPGTITFGATGLPAGVSGSFNPPTAVVTSGSTTGSTVLTLSATANAAAATNASYSITATPALGTAHSASGTVTVIGFGLSISPPSASVAPGDSHDFTVTASGNSTAISLTATNLPSGVTAQFNPSQIDSGATSTLTLSADPGAANAAATTFTVTGDDGTATAHATAQIAVTTLNDFSISGTPDPISVLIGSASGAALTVNTAVQAGSAETITLGVSGLPTGVTGTFSPATVTAGNPSTLTLVASSSAVSASSLSFTVSGTSPSIPAGHSASVGLTVVAPPTVALTAPAANASVSGTVSVSATATVDPNAGGLASIVFFDGSVQIGSATSSPATIQWNTTQVANGKHSLTAKVTDGAGNSATSASVQVTVSNNGSNDFALHLSSTTFTLVPGGSAVTLTLTPSASGAPGDISLTTNVLPAGVTVDFSPNPVAQDGTSTVTITAASSAVSGSGTLTVTGSAAGLQRTATASYSVTGPSGVSCTLTQPSDGAQVSGVITLGASAVIGKPSATLQRIDFIVDSTTVGTATSSPGTASWDTSTAQVGSHQLTARCTDSTGGTANSSPITLIVSRGSTGGGGGGCSSAGGGAGGWSLLAALALVGFVRRRRAA